MTGRFLADSVSFKLLYPVPRKFHTNAESVIQELLGNGLAGLTEWSKQRKETSQAIELPNLVEQIKKDRLFLSFNMFPAPSQEECVDDAFFDVLILEGEEQQTRSVSLVYTLNSIKEDFATARYLYYQSLSKIHELSAHNDLTHYCDTADRAQFGLASGLLKTAFRLAADCLDKIAVFLNEYLELGHDPARVSFNNVWFEKLDFRKGDNAVLKNHVSSNRFMGALRDLQ